MVVGLLKPDLSLNGTKIRINILVQILTWHGTQKGCIRGFIYLLNVLRVIKGFFCLHYVIFFKV